MSKPTTAIWAHRPWRQLGAAICLVLGMMFLVGLRALDPSTQPMRYLTYWSVVLLLVVCVCTLAAIDVAHTLRAVRRWRRGEAELDASTLPPRVAQKEDRK